MCWLNLATPLECFRRLELVVGERYPQTTQIGSLEPVSRCTSHNRSIRWGSILIGSDSRQSRRTLLILASASSSYRPFTLKVTVRSSSVWIWWKEIVRVSPSAVAIFNVWQPKKTRRAAALQKGAQLV